MSVILPIRKRPERRFAFTTKRLTDYPAPAVGRVELTDSGCPDLKLRVSEAGVKTFCVFRKLNGKPVRATIGQFPEWGIDAARKKAKELVGQMLQGVNPSAAKRAAKTAGTTFGELAKDYIEDAKTRKKTWREDDRQIETYLSKMKARPLKDIQPEHVAALHAKLGKENGKYVANRVLMLLSTMFTFAMKPGRRWVGANPAKGIDKFPEVKRDRFLQPDELPRFFSAVMAEPSEVCRDFFLVALLTGARRMNVLTMRWADVDIDRGVWRIPDTKSGQPVVLPLIPEVVQILRNRFGNESEWVFPSRCGQGHLKDPMLSWRNILKRAGITNLRIHDLRRTLGSYQAINGVSLPIIAKSLGQGSTAATGIYARLTLDPVREAVTTATTAILAAAKKEDGK